MFFLLYGFNSINSDWVHLLLSHNGHPVDGALVGGRSPICCCTLFGSAGAENLNSKLDNQIESLVHSWETHYLSATQTRNKSLWWELGSQLGHCPQKRPLGLCAQYRTHIFLPTTPQQHVNKYRNSS